MGVTMTILVVISTTGCIILLLVLCYVWAKGVATSIVRSEYLENTIPESLGIKLLSIKTDGPKEVAFFSSIDKVSIMEQWIKRGYIR